MMLSVFKPAGTKIPAELASGSPDLCMCALAGCTTFKPPQISYDDELPPLPNAPALADDRPRPLHIPPAWSPARGGKKGASEANEPIARIESANDAARVEPRRGRVFQCRAGVSL